MAKKKRITQKQKDFNAKFKKEMQDKGILPQDKPRLNRKKFAREVITEWDAVTEVSDLTFYLFKAIFSVVGKDMIRVTNEEIGILKVLKLALETKKFMENLKVEGRTEYRIGEYYEKVYDPIMKL